MRLSQLRRRSVSCPSRGTKSGRIPSLPPSSSSSSRRPSTPCCTQGTLHTSAPNRHVDQVPATLCESPKRAQSSSRTKGYCGSSLHPRWAARPQRRSLRLMMPVTRLTGQWHIADTVLASGPLRCCRVRLSGCSVFASASGQTNFVLCYFLQPTSLSPLLHANDFKCRAHFDAMDTL